MTIPIQPANVNPQVHQTEDPFLQALLQGTQLGLRAQELELNKARLKMETAAQQFEEKKHQSTLSLAASMAPAIQQILFQGGSQSTVQIPSLPTAGAGIGQTLPMEFRADVSPWANAVRQMEPAAMPDFLRLAQPELSARRDARVRAEENLARIQRNEQALATVKDPRRRQIAGAVLSFAESGVNMSAQEQLMFWPELAPLLTRNEPERVNAFTTLMRTGQFTVGQGRHLLGIGPVPGLDDSFKFPEATSQLANVTRQKNQALLTIAESSAPIMAALEQEIGGLNLPGSFVAQIRKNVPFAVALNAIQDPQQRQYVAATRRFVDAQRYFLSGQQTSDQEFMNQFMYTVVLSTDDAETASQKKAMRNSVIDAMRIAAGGGSAARTLEGLLQDAKDGGWSPAIVQGIERQLQEARQWEQNPSRSNSLYLNPDPVTPDSIGSGIQEWDAWIRNNVP